MKYINYETTMDEDVAAFNTENDGHGQLLSYRAMHKNVREYHVPAGPPGLVYDVITMPEGLERRKNVGKKRKDCWITSYTLHSRNCKCTWK